MSLTVYNCNSSSKLPRLYIYTFKSVRSVEDKTQLSMTLSPVLYALRAAHLIISRQVTMKYIYIIISFAYTIACCLHAAIEWLSV